MKRVLIFSTAYIPFVGGAEVAIKEITDRLKDEYVFDMLTVRLSRDVLKRERVGAITVYRVGWGIGVIDKLLAPFLGALLTLRLNAEHRYDAYWTMMATFMSGAAFIANIISLKKKVPIVLTLQEGDSDAYLKTRWFGLVDLSWRLALSHASFLTVISTYLAERAQRLGYKGHAELIPNGVDVGRFEKIDEAFSLGALRGQWNLSQDDTVLFTSSRLVEKNGVEDVIRALPLLPERFKFVIAGTGVLEGKLRDIARELEVDARVRFLGFVPHEKLPQHLRGSEIFIRPSLSEGMGNSFIEAFAAWVPVIATQEGGIADFLFDPFLNPDKPSTGRAVPTRNSQAIAAATLWYRDPANRAHVADIVENAHMLAKEKYSWDGIARAMGDVFDKVS